MYPIYFKNKIGLRRGGKGALIQKNKSTTISTRQDQVLFEPKSMVYDARGNGNGTTVPTVTGDHENRITDYTAVVTSPLKEGQISDEQDSPSDDNYCVRRLNPLECCRLQGFPDFWCDDIEIKDPTEEDIKFWEDVFEEHRNVISHSKKPKSRQQIEKWLKNPYNDSAEYKMWGNGVALPNVAFVLSGIAWWDSIQDENESESSG